MSDSVNLSLDNPPRTLQSGNGLQVWRLRTRKLGSGTPTVEVHLHEDGVFRAIVIPETQVVSEESQVVIGNWNATLLAKASGVSAEARIISERANEGALVEIAALEWIASMHRLASGAPATRIYHVGVEDRTHAIRAESRIAWVEPETRQISAGVSGNT